MAHLTVSTAWLEAHLDDPNVVVIDIRGHVIPASEPPPHYFAHDEAYAESHIPGARFVNWVTDITVNGPLQNQVAPPEKFAALMSALGIDEDIMVVAYDDANGMFAARLWWALHYYGHRRAVVLDGGWNAWVSEGRPVSARVPVVTPRVFVPRLDASIRRDRHAVEKLLHTDTSLIDVRSAAEYRGESARAKRKGHIPGAVSLPIKEALATPDGRMPPPETLRACLAKPASRVTIRMSCCTATAASAPASRCLRIASPGSTAARSTTAVGKSGATTTRCRLSED
ncbi:MAG: rhodanese domain-containing protein [Chloroflexi bacterium OLB13]|nr:MAG: rhodanese domain-containing protein [Chloroflexi bacterium OLB13]